MFSDRTKKKSHFNKELHYIMKELQKAKAYDKKTAFAALSDKDLISCFEDSAFFTSLSKTEFQQLFQEVVTRISNGNGYITPTVKVEMFSEKKMIKKNLQNDDLVVRARCSLDNTIEFFLPEKNDIDKMSADEKRNLGLSYLFNIYHETVHARQFINTNKLFDTNAIKSLKPFDKFVAIYEIALISNKLLQQDIRLVEDYVDTVNELEANMRAYAVFKQNIEHGCFVDSEYATKFINEKIVDDCAFNPDIQKFATTIMKATDLELRQYELSFKTKANKAIVAMYSELDRQAVYQKLHKYNGYLYEAFNGYFKDFITLPNTPAHVKKLYESKDFVSLKAIKEERDIMKAAEKEIKDKLLSDEDELIADEIDKINQTNAKIVVSKAQEVPQNKKQIEKEKEKEDIISFLSEAPATKKIKDDAQK